MPCTGHAYRGVENSWKNPQKIVKTACNSQNMVYSMCVAERERVTPLPKIGNKPTTKSKGVFHNGYCKHNCQHNGNERLQRQRRLFRQRQDGHQCHDSTAKGPCPCPCRVAGKPVGGCPRCVESGLHNQRWGKMVCGVDCFRWNEARNDAD